MKVSQVRVGPRHRKNLGDIAALSRSIQYHGTLLQPILVDSEGILVSGLRRLEAVRRLGWDEIDAIVIDLDDPLRAEQDENTLHKPFTPTEREAIGSAIYEREQAAAKERKSRPGLARTGTVPAQEKARARDKVAEKVGWSGRTYIRMKRIVEAANAEPERFGDLPEQIDAGVLSIKGAEAEMRQRKRTVPSGVKAAPEHGRRAGPTLKQSLRGLEQATISLQGLAEGLEGQMFGDWSRLYSEPDAQGFFDVIAQELPVVIARLKRVLRERGQANGDHADRSSAL